MCRYGKNGDNVVSKVQQFDQLIGILLKNDKIILKKYIDKLTEKK